MFMRQPILLIVGASVLVFISAGCGHVLYADGPYHGKVIDKETKRPIEGAAVVAGWRKEAPAAHPIITIYDAQEAVTDREGNFTVPGIVGGSVNPLAKIREPSFNIFKPGYAAYGETRESAMPRENDRILLALGVLTTREQRVRNLSDVLFFSTCTPRELAERLEEKMRVAPPYCVPEEKIPNLLRLKKMEEYELGLGTGNIFKGSRPLRKETPK